MGRCYDAEGFLGARGLFSVYGSLSRHNCLGKSKTMNNSERDSSKCIQKYSLSYTIVQVTNTIVLVFKCNCSYHNYMPNP